jgi:hypothetical protein
MRTALAAMRFAALTILCMVNHAGSRIENPSAGWKARGFLCGE